MSKSKKKQVARKRAQEAGVQPQPVDVAAEDNDFDEPDEPGTEVLAMPERQVQPLNEALYEKAVAAATGHGLMREEGEAMAYLFNGDSLSMKYVEGAEGTEEPDRLMIAAFKLGVVFQVDGRQQVVYKPGDWEAEINRLAETQSEDPDAEATEGL